MENKKPLIESQGIQNNESPDTDLGFNKNHLMKNQSNTSQQQFRMIQYGMKPPTYTNNQYTVNQQPQQTQPLIWSPAQMQQLQQPSNIHNHCHVIQNNVYATQENQKVVMKPFETVDKKKLNTNTQQLRSPSAKRLPHGNVIMQGWLHKQGSDGLKVWRKRWFVLSDYCLYYYKGSEEEKVLGSILLPSYKVSLCGLNDKVYRKYAFKCEHLNMRTYYLAADSQESLTNWMKALNLACMLQSNIEYDQQSGPSVSSMYNTSLDKSDNSFHHQYNVPNNTHIHMHSTSNTSTASVSENTVSISTPSQSFDFGNNNKNNMQPLYANAPPKPRRLTDAGYSSSSPEFSAAERYQNMQQQFLPYSTAPNRMEQQYYKSALNSSVNIWNYDNQISGHYMLPRDNIHHYNVYDREIQIKPHDANNLERRTPDTYGRSKLNAHKLKDSSDYEDIYQSDEIIYKRPLSPVMSSVSPGAIPHRSYTPLYIAGPPRRDSSFAMQQERIPNTIPRPHSADFLDYEVKHRNINKLNSVHIQPRPKSSLDIRRSPTDNYYYSKESYAESMRKSALYLQQLPHYARRNDNIIISNGQKLYQTSKNIHDIFANMQMQAQEKQSYLKSNEGSLNDDISGRHLKNSMSHITDEDYNNELMNINQGRESPKVRDCHNDQFKRSASARLFRTPIPSSNEEYYGSRIRDGDQKREESMKRLLEWKQRMLQSPLNRKISSGFLMPRTILRSNMYVPSSTNPHHSHFQIQQQPDDVSQCTFVDIPTLQYNSYSSDDEASGTMCIPAHETYFRPSNKKNWSSNTIIPARSSTNISLQSPFENEYDQSRSSPSSFVKNQLPSQQSERDLIQHHINLQKSKLANLSAAKRLKNLQKLEQIKQHLIELEKQYEKGKPLVNLVDNMVKLGSLYRNPNDQYYNINVKDRLEFNQQIQEQRLLAEEKRDWNRLSPNHMQLQTKVQQLYHLDRLLQEESNTLQSLQQDKEKIKQALVGLRQGLNMCDKDPTELEQTRKQRLYLENELSRVHFMLAQNSKKLEETVAGNARLEQELLVLRQKLQISRQQRNSVQFSNTGANDNMPCLASTSAALETELHRVQGLVRDLQRQRQELSEQVRQLTDRSYSLSQQIRPSYVTPVILPNNGIINKKRISTSWRETDLDTMHSTDYGINLELQNNSYSSTPVYVNNDFNTYGHSKDINHHHTDDNQQYLECAPQDKSEIKTVRIVKRESERRQRDKEKINVSSESNLLHIGNSVVEEDNKSLNNYYIPNTQNKLTNISLKSPILNNLSMGDNHNNLLNRQSSISSPSLHSQLNLSQNDIHMNSADVSFEKTRVLSPIFKSEAARQIINEMSTGVRSESSTSQNTARRIIPKEKRRHYTAPHDMIIKNLNILPTEDKFGLNNRRARDDLDMERALRQRTDTPDVIRSTISSRELKYNESTIDNVLGTPNKITIPERYIPEQLPQLSVEEQQQRLRKVESIKKMLSDTTILSSTSTSKNKESRDNTENVDTGSTSNVNETTIKIVEEKRQREHLLQLNQILAKQVMEMSKVVAVKALANLPLESDKINADDDDLSPITPLPLYQQRENYYT